MKKVTLATDGVCIGNPGPGGWACVLCFGSVQKELFGYAPLTTNNRMEMMAAIQGLLALKEPCEVEITTDSEYLLHGITKWAAAWKKPHWWRKRSPVSNVDLWIELDHLNAAHRTTWLWTRGHSGHPGNGQSASRPAFARPRPGLRASPAAGEPFRRRSTGRAFRWGG
ncbi:MAG TPA: ribonuclease HI [Solibacterales bacterium]|nr:ribonuclease HI [Bryobacterales bacterium]